VVRDDLLSLPLYKGGFFVVKTNLKEVVARYCSTPVSVRVLCQVAMLIALAFVLERLVPIYNVFPIRITLAFIPMMSCGMLFGPLWGAAAYGIADILGWPIMGLAPIPLVLVSRVLTGFLFGLILHRKSLKFWPHSIISALSTEIICSMGLTTLGLTQIAHFILPLENYTYPAILLMRLPQFPITIALQIAVFPVLLKLREALCRAGYVTLNRKSVFDSD